MIRIDETPLDPAALTAEFMRSVGDAGAVATFSGIVRREGDHAVDALFLDHAPGLTRAAIENAVKKACARWPLINHLVAHRVGRVGSGETVVFVATAAAHRRAAFEACDFLMDFLKTDAPFWKKQISRRGDEWIEPRAEDYTDRDRWR